MSTIKVEQERRRGMREGLKMEVSALPAPQPLPRIFGMAAQRAGFGRPTAGTLILQELRRQIVEMELAPGAPLNDKELTQAFGVSRTPLREALIRLAEEGLVEIFPQSGTFVGRIPHGALAEAVVVRKALEGAAIQYVLEQADEASLQQLDQVIARQQAFASLEDQRGFHEADEAFHQVLAEIAGHPGLWRIAQQAKTQIDRCRRLTLPVPGRMNHVIAEHQAILASIRRRDRGGAASALEAHLNAVLPDAEHIRAEFPHYFV
jgi:DNA-binding GntR family transcriptional regulator